MKSRFKKIVLHIIAGIITIWLAKEFVPGVKFNGFLKDLVLAGLFLGLINIFIKPILNLIALPLRIITLGLFGLVINMGILRLIEFFLKDSLVFDGITPLFWTAIIVWALSLIVNRIK